MSPRLSILALTLSYLVAMVPADAAEEVAIKDLPKPVTNTITQRYPKAELLEARKTMDENMVVYEVDFTVNRKHVEIAILPEGQIHWVAIDLPLNELPKPVMAGVRKKYPNAMLNGSATVFVVKGGKDQFLHYSVELTTKAGRHHELDVSAKGLIEDDQDVTN